MPEPSPSSQNNSSNMQTVARFAVPSNQVLHDVTDTTVQILAIISKAEAAAWLEGHGTSSPGGPAGKGEG